MKIPFISEAVRQCITSLRNNNVALRLRYTRKSTEQEDRQAHSHEQQADAMTAKWGELPITELWWQDSHTGTTFDRPGYQDMLAFCEANPQPLDAPGVIEIYDPSRLGRALTPDGEEDIMTFLFELERFKKLGWRIRFTNVELSGNIFADTVTIVAHAYLASSFSRKLKIDVSRGKTHYAGLGGWIHGRPPFPTKRFDPHLKRVLAPGEAAALGKGGTILVIDDPADLQLWVDAAQMVLNGHSLDAVGEALFDRGVMAPRGGKWGHSQVRNLLTNPALIGKVHCTHRDETGVKHTTLVDAKWGPLVPQELFDAVQEVLASRGKSGPGRRRKRREDYPLSGLIVCAGCGATFDGGRLGDKQGRKRCYVHPETPERMDPELAARREAAGCKRWTVDADELEARIAELIARERSSEEYENYMKDALRERHHTRTRAAESVEAAEQRVAELQAEKEAVLRLQVEAVKRRMDAEQYWSEIDAIDRQIHQAQRSLRKSRRVAAESDTLWERVQTSIHETRNLAAVWDNLSLVERKRVLDRWVDAVLIAVEPIEGKKRANHKFGIVYLESAPGVPQEFLIGGLAEAFASSNPCCTSCKTHSSASTCARIRSASIASGVFICPSAHAACPRISGSGSESAATSEGTASGDPQLPIATATFLSRPLRLARFTGEFLKRRENSSCVSCIRSISRAPCTPCRGQNASSEVSCTNLLLLNGHTSWQMSHP